MKIKDLIRIFILLQIFFVLITGTAFALDIEASLEAPPVYFIYSVDDLRAIEYNSDILAGFLLMNDIEITDETWNPIGSTNRPFKGIFYGNNHTITFTKDTELSQPIGYENSGSGLFGNIYSGEIYDLTIVLNGNLSSDSANVGSLVGIMNGNSSQANYTSSSIVNCTVLSNGYRISGAGNTGGLVGSVINGSVENSFSDCSVLSEGNNSGGLIGYVFNGTFNNSSAAGSISSKGNNAGGFIGLMRMGSISDSFATGSVEAIGYAGAFAGYISDETTISNSFANGAVKPKGVFGNFIGGWAEDYKPTVADCFYQETEVDLEPVPPVSDVEVYYKNYTLFYALFICLAVIIFLFAIAAVFYLKKRN